MFDSFRNLRCPLISYPWTAPQVIHIGHAQGPVHGGGGVLLPSLIICLPSDVPCHLFLRKDISNQKWNGCGSAHLGSRSNGSM